MSRTARPVGYYRQTVSALVGKSRKHTVSYWELPMCGAGGSAYTDASDVVRGSTEVL
jgi:hypothetical protein